MLTLFDAAKRYRNPLSQLLLKGVVTEDELFSRIPFIPKDGDAFSFRREKALGSAAFIAPGGATTESSPTSDLVTVPKREVVTDVDIPSFAIANQGGEGVVVEALMKKGKAVGRKLAEACIVGGHVTSHTLGSAADPFAALSAAAYGPTLDSRLFGPGELKYTHAGQGWQFRAPGDRDFGPVVPATSVGTYVLKSDNPSKWISFTITPASATANGRTSIEFASSTEEFDGLIRNIAPGQTRAPVATDGDDLSFKILDELIDAVKVRENLAFVMPAVLRRKYKALYRGMGGAIPEVVLGGFDPQGNPSERRTLAYESIPILKSDNLPTNETVGSINTGSSVILVSLSEEGYYIGAFGGSSENLDADPIRRIVLGFQSTFVGNLEGKNAQRWRQAFYGTAALGSELAVARARGIKTV